ncbi:hypothetical protein VH567_15460 [Sphingomonas sp. 4RDLI-65]
MAEEMSPLERACRAAHAEHNDDLVSRREAADPTWGGWLAWTDVVRAVLLAAREPTEFMEMNAVYNVSDTAQDSPRYEPADVWRNMIDALLVEKP